MIRAENMWSARLCMEKVLTQMGSVPDCASAPTANGSMTSILMHCMIPVKEMTTFRTETEHSFLIFHGHYS